MQSRVHSEIINNLQRLGVNAACIERIMSSVNSMPGKEHVEGALKFLTEVTVEKSRREQYWQYSNYMAEYFCTISNLGLFAVAFYYRDFATLAAGTFSALSHAIPSQRLHDLDMAGIAIIFAKVIANYKVIMERPEAVAWGLGALTVNLLDTIITRKYLDKIGPAIHVAWHLAAALALYKFNQAQIEVTAAELQSVSQAIPQNTIPDFLRASYENISNHIQNISGTTRCTIS